MGKKLFKYESFNQIFGIQNIYFDSHYIHTKEKEGVEFFNEQDSLITQFRHLHMFLETLKSVKVLRDKGIIKNNLCLGVLKAGEVWYATVLLLIFGIIDQQTKSLKVQAESCDKCGRNKKTRMQNIFLEVMNSLDDKDKTYLVNHYKSERRKSNFTEVVDDIYATRNFYAHQIESLDIPQAKGLAFEYKEEEGVFISFNAPHDEIVLYVVKALLRYMRYEGELEVYLSKEVKSFTDLL